MSTDDARTAFLHRLIDDAALFPPARESMERAVAGHAEHRAGPHGWIQGRFLCPASRLMELVDVLPTDAPSWPVSLILDGPATAGSWEAGVEGDAHAAAQLADRTEGRAWVEAVEVRLPDADPERLADRAGVLEAALKTAGPERDVVPYLEVPVLVDGWRRSVPAAVATLAGVRVAAGAGAVAERPRAKVRCGGPQASDHPSAEQVAALVAACVEHRVPFKATAGLHHPLPEGHRLGFLGVIGGAVLLAAGAITATELPDVLRSDDPRAWTLDERRLGWRDRSTGVTAIAEARATLVDGYGSCSFDEPTEDLTDLGILPVAEEVVPR